jgi:predicted nucleic acid-binding protein
MRALVDTNVLVRHLTGDPPRQAHRATAFLAGQNELILTDLVLAELVYVLESYYERPRDEVANAARALVELPAVECDQELLRTSTVLRARPQAARWPRALLGQRAPRSCRTRCAGNGAARPTRKAWRLVG